MISRVLSRLTYANVMSTLAVFLLMGGVSYAAATLAANSVGSRELKNNAVTTTEVKDKSLRAGDFANGQLPAGPQGKQGVPGPKGDPGAPDSSDLLDPSSDLANGGRAQISIDGVPFPLVTAFRLDCPSTCTLAIARSMTTDLTYNAWFEQAQVDPAAATKTFSFIVYDQTLAPVQRYHVSGGIPASLYDNGKRFVLVFETEHVQRVSP